MLKEEALQIITDTVIEKDGELIFHIAYDKQLTLKELSEVLDLVNKAINDSNREHGVKNNGILGKQYAPEVMAVNQGSVILNLLVYVVAPITTSVIGSFIYDRLTTLGHSSAKKKSAVDEKDSLAFIKYPISITVNANNIDIHIHNE